MNLVEHLVLLDEFVCTAGECPDNCCHSWDAEIDADTRQRWEAVDSEEDRRWLFAATEPSSGAGQSLRFTRQVTGECTHLAHDGLCRLQTRFGHEMLPQTCREYPRVTVGQSAHAIESALLSCPEIAFLALRHDPDRALFRSTGYSLLPDEDTALKLTALTRRVLASRGYTPGIRLVFLARLLDKLASKSAGRALAGGSIAKVLDVSAERLAQQLEALARSEKSGKLRFNRVAAGGFWRLVLASGTGGRYAEFGEAISGGLLGKLVSREGDVSPGSEPALFDAIQELRAQADPGVTPAVRSALDNLLIMLSVNRGFPLAPFKGNLVVSFLDVLVALAQVQLLVWHDVLAGRKTGLAELSRHVYRVERALGHNYRLFEHLKSDQRVLRVGEYAESLALLG